MLRPACIPFLLFALYAVPAMAQDSPFDARRDEPAVPPTSVQPSAATPQSAELWFYERERERNEDPKMMVRRRAELKGLQRAERLASQKWYGIDNSRPYVNSSPLLGGYQASFWGSNTYNPNRWRVFTPYTVTAPRRSRY